MIICSDEAALDEYFAQADPDDEPDWDDPTNEEESDDEDGVPAKENFKLSPAWVTGYRFSLGRFLICWSI